MRNQNKSVSALIRHPLDGRVIRIFLLRYRVDVVLAIHAVVLSENDSYISK